MRRFLFTAVLLAWLMLCMLPASAAPVRDPFQAPAGSVPATSPEQAPVVAPEQEAPAVQPTRTEVSANTGFDATTWLGVSYLLIAAGAAALVLARPFSTSARY